MTIYRSAVSDVAIHPSGWFAIPSLGIEVTRLPVIDTTHALPDGTPLFARLTYTDALAVAALHGAQLLHPDRYKDENAAGAVQLTPYLGTPTAEVELQHSERHDADVWRQLRAFAWDGKAPVVGAGKHWVAGAPEGRSRLQGWDKDGGGPGVALWQPDMVAHNREHFDDGTTTVLERPIVAASASPSGPLVTDKPERTHLGDRGDKVSQWQSFLAGAGFSLGVIDGAHGPRTEAASIAWEAAQQPKEATIEFIQARNFTTANRSRVDLVVLHSTENPVAAGVAHNVARWFQGPSSPKASCHFVVGPDITVQCVSERDVAWAAPGANRTGIQIEQVGQAQFTDWGRDGYDPKAGLPVLRRSAALVKAICKRWAIPVERVDAAGLRAGKRGITSHATVTEAFHQSSHQDPGLQGDRRWPWPTYLAMVAA